MDKKKPIGYSKKDTSEMKALIERTEPKSGDYVGSGTVTEVPKKKKKMKRMMDGGMANAMMQRGTQPNERGPIKGAPDYTTMPIRGPGGRIRGGGGVPVQGPGGVVVPPMRPEGKKIPGQIRDRLMGMMGRAGKGTEYPGMPKMGGMKGGGLALKGREHPDMIKPRGTKGPMIRLGRAGKGTEHPGMTKPRGLMIKPRGMKGGGLARKGVGMALAKGGLVKANGCAQRGKSKGKMV